MADNAGTMSAQSIFEPNKPGPFWAPSGLDSRVDSEGGQAIYRTWTAFVAIFVSAGLTWLEIPGSAWMLQCAFGFLAYAYAWTWVVARDLGAPVVRQHAALVLDQIVLNLGFLHGYPAVGLAMWAAVMASMGHGLRFGLKRGITSGMLGAGLSLLMLTRSGDWLSLPAIPAGISLMSLLLPLYAVRLSHQMTTARDNALAHARHMERLTQRDPLTGALNRLGLEAAANTLRQQGRPRPAALAYIDLDGFKAVNDQLGHATGDMVLCRVAERLHAGLRKSSAVARLGGDEFAVLITDVPSRSALEQIGQQLVNEIRTICPTGRDDLAVQASIGIWQFDSDANLHDVLKAADALMYRCKQAGPGRYELGGETATMPSG